MANPTVAEIQQSISAIVNQSATAPTVGSDEYNLWLNFMNRAVDEWSEAHDWDDLRTQYWPQITGVSTATIPLPANFRRLAAVPLLYENGQGFPTQYPEILPEEKLRFQATDNYCQVWGNTMAGYNLLINPGNLVSGASVCVEYFAEPDTLTSPNQQPQMLDPHYIINQTIAYIFESRSDPRFQVEEAKAKNQLQAMVENVNDFKYNSFAGKNYVGTPEKKLGWRIGRD